MDFTFLTNKAARIKDIENRRPVEDYSQEELLDAYQLTIMAGVKKYMDTIGNYNISFEDAVQMCWIKILEAMKRDNVDRLDFPVVKKIVHDALVDETRRHDNPVYNHSPMDFDQSMERTDLDNSGDSDDQTYDGYFEDPSRKIDDKLSGHIDELLDAFPEGSRGNKWIKFYFEKNGIKHFGINPEGGARTRTKQGYKGGYTDDNFAKYLGYASGGSSGFKRFNERMLNFVKDVINNESPIWPKGSDEEI